MQLIYITSQVDAILIYNIWRFQSPNISNLTTINSKIKELDLNGYNYNFDTSLMHPLVFETIQSLHIANSIGSIQAGLFRHFKQINLIHFHLDSLENFFHKIGIEWTRNLNKATQPWLIFSSIYSWVNGPEYTYPDTDFCLFAQHPQQINLIYILNSLSISECTVTVRWLLLNYFSQDRHDVFDAYPILNFIFSICVNSSNGTFDFDPLLVKCNLTHDTGETTRQPEFNQVQFILEFIQDLLIFIGIPCACSLGLALNALIIRAVYKNKEKELKDDFYTPT
jgi:hypothetical protein